MKKTREAVCSEPGFSHTAASVSQYLFKEMLPSVIYIFSDMEFNYCKRNADGPYTRYLRDIERK